jgi:hypothetical protein
MALVVDRQQGFLHQVFHVIRQSDQAHPEKTAQMRAQILQERMVRRRITAQPAQQQIPQLCFPLAHAAFSFYSQPLRVWLQTGEKIIPADSCMIL